MEGRALVAEALLASAEGAEVRGGLGDGVVEQVEGDATRLICTNCQLRGVGDSNEAGREQIGRHDATGMDKVDEGDCVRQMGQNTAGKLLTLNLSGRLAALHDGALPLEIEEASRAISSCTDEINRWQWQTYTGLDMMEDAVK